MTKNWSRLIVMTLFMFLTFTASASAECAWVMWSFAFEKTGFEAYDIELASPTRLECSQVLSDKATGLKRRGYTDVVGGFPGSQEVLARKGDMDWRFFCLPDTVDPRGPKGK